MIAIDTNVLVYAFDMNEPLKQAIAKRVIDSLGQTGQGVMLWQVACEFLACLRKWENANRITRAEAMLFYNQGTTLFPLQLPQPTILAKSFDLRNRFSLIHWDSLLISACLNAGVSILYSEDLAAGANYDAVQVINPFPSI